MRNLRDRGLDHLQIAVRDADVFPVPGHGIRVAWQVEAADDLREKGIADIDDLEASVVVGDVGVGAVDHKRHGRARRRHAAEDLRRGGIRDIDHGQPHVAAGDVDETAGDGDVPPVPGGGAAHDHRQSGIGEIDHLQPRGAGGDEGEVTGPGHRLREARRVDGAHEGGRLGIGYVDDSESSRTLGQIARGRQPPARGPTNPRRLRRAGSARPDRRRRRSNDKLLTPFGKTIAEVAHARGFNLLLDAVNYIADTNPDSRTVSGLLDPEILENEGPFAAIDALLGEGTIEAVVSYHVTGGSQRAVNVVPVSGENEIKTLLPGATFMVTANGTINAVGNSASIVAADVFASNGIIHAINAVILPIDLGLEDTGIVNIRDDRKPAVY